ncbi:MAG: iron ABC transporter permease [Solobacterium sp.]|nr:iron ABC transporter permease [Solobacterium sp.]
MTYISEKGYQKRRNRERIFFLVFLVILFMESIFLLLWGDEVYSFSNLIDLLCNRGSKGATYAIKTIRLAKVCVGILAGFCFGVAGNVFQKMMRNPLASVDVMGITSGASVLAVMAIILFGLSGTKVSLFALAGGLISATMILFLSRKNQFSVAKMILSGIGLQAMFQAMINFILLKNSDYNVASALRWLSGSLNGVRMHDVPFMFLVTILVLMILIYLEKELEVLVLGEELPITLGIKIGRSRLKLLYCTVILASSSVAITGPLSSVAFMAGPISTRLLKTGAIGSMHAGLMGACIVLISEAIGQFLFVSRYPVGVITGVIGAPYLIYLLLKMNKE